MDAGTNSVLLIIYQHYKKPVKITRGAVEFLVYFANTKFRQLLRVIADPENLRLSFIHNAAIQVLRPQFKFSESRLSVSEAEPASANLNQPVYRYRYRQQSLNVAYKPAFVNLTQCAKPERVETKLTQFADLVYYQMDFDAPVQCTDYVIETTGACITAASALYYGYEGYGDFLQKLIRRSPDYGK